MGDKFSDAMAVVDLLEKSRISVYNQFCDVLRSEMDLHYLDESVRPLFEIIMLTDALDVNLSAHKVVYSDNHEYALKIINTLARNLIAVDAPAMAIEVGTQEL